ncbi:hypothetical protein ACTFIZ_005846 [Dictyostelium cf. discoideum]
MDFSFDMIGGGPFAGSIIPNTGAISSKPGEHYIERQLVIYAHYLAAKNNNVSYEEGFECLYHLGKSFDFTVNLNDFVPKNFPKEMIKKDMEKSINNGKYQISKIFMNGLKDGSILFKSNAKYGDYVLENSKDTFKKNHELLENNIPSIIYMTNNINFGKKVLDRLEMDDDVFKIYYSSKTLPSKIKSKKTIIDKYPWTKEFFRSIKYYLYFIQDLQQYGREYHLIMSTGEEKETDVKFEKF